jgi:hypothetical protein
MRFIRRHLPSLTDSEFVVLICTDQLEKDFETDQIFKKKFYTALNRRGSIKMRVTFYGTPEECEVLERGFKRMDIGVPICNASVSHAFQSIAVHLGNAAVEQANGEK